MNSYRVSKENEALVILKKSSAHDSNYVATWLRCESNCSQYTRSQHCYSKDVHPLTFAEGLHLQCIRFTSTNRLRIGREPSKKEIAPIFPPLLFD